MGLDAGELWNFIPFESPISKQKLTLRQSKHKNHDWWRYRTQAGAACPLVDESEQHHGDRDNFSNSVLLTFDIILTMEYLHAYIMSMTLNLTGKKRERHLIQSYELIWADSTICFRLNYNRCYIGHNSDECSMWESFSKEVSFHSYHYYWSLTKNQINAYWYESMPTKY